MPKPYPPLQTLRSHPHDAARSYAEAVDSGMPYDGGHYEDADAVTEDVIFSMIAKAAKSHQMLRFQVTVRFDPSLGYSEEAQDIFVRLQNVLKAMAPELYLWPFSFGGRESEEAILGTTTFHALLYSRTIEKIPPSREDEQREGVVRAMIPELFDRRNQPKRHPH